jgi:hypothetical protein
MPQRRKRNNGPLLIGVAVVLALCCIGGIVLFALDSGKDNGKPAANANASTAPAASAPAPNPADALVKAITDKLGKPNRDVPAPKVTSWPDDPAKTIDVEWALNDNLTENLRKVGARGDVLDILKAVKANATWKYTQVRLTGTFSMADKYGNTAETAVIKLTYTADTIAKINPDGLTPDRVYDLAASQQVHPEFR